MVRQKIESCIWFLSNIILVWHTTRTLNKTLKISASDDSYYERWLKTLVRSWLVGQFAEDCWSPYKRTINQLLRSKREFNRVFGHLGVLIITRSVTVNGRNQCVSELNEMWKCRYFTNTLKSTNTLNSRIISRAGQNAEAGWIHRCYISSLLENTILILLLHIDLDDHHVMSRSVYWVPVYRLNKASRRSGSIEFTWLCVLDRMQVAGNTTWCQK